MTKVFLSYTHSDKAIARRLATWLRLADVSVWIDEVEIDIGESLIERIAEGIREADYVISLLSTASITSSWVRKELSLATSKGINHRKVNVLPVKVDDCELPFALSDVLYADLSDKSNFHEEFEKLARALGSSLRGTIVEQMYVANDWRTILMVRTFAHRREWRHPPYDIDRERRPLKRVISVFGDRLHPVPDDDAKQSIRSTVKSCLAFEPGVLGLGGMGRTAKIIESEIRKSNSRMIISFWGRDAGLDAADFLERLDVSQPY